MIAHKLGNCDFKSLCNSHHSVAEDSALAMATTVQKIETLKMEDLIKAVATIRFYNKAATRSIDVERHSYSDEKPKLQRC